MDGVFGAENTLARHVRACARVFALCVISLGFASLSHAAADSAQRQWQDDLGNQWQLPETLPTRWIVLGPQIVDMLTAIGAEQRIVGVQDDHPQPERHELSLSGYRVIGQSGNISEEKVRALRPDLVVFWPTGLSPVQQLRLQRLGIPLLAISPKQLADIPERIRWLGQLSGRTAAANILADKEAAALRQVREQYASGQRLRGFYQVWQNPLYSLSRHHLLSQAMSLCGVDTIVPDGNIQAPIINAESVLAANTEIILVGKNNVAQAKAFWRRFKTLPAVHQGAIIGVDDFALTRPGLSMLRAIPSLCRAIAPWRIRQGVPESK